MIEPALSPRQRLRPSHAVQVLTLVMLSVFAIASAQATILPALSAEGVAAECPAGEHLVGISLNAGAVVDAVHPLCAPFVAAQRKFGEWKRGTPEDGSGDPSLLKDAACPADRYIHAMAVRFTPDTKRLDRVVLFCNPVINRSAATPVCASSGEECAAVASFDQSCPADEAATGIHVGRSAQVDSLGLICGPTPTVFGAPKPTSAGEPTSNSAGEPTPSPVGVPTSNSAGEPKRSRREVYEKLKKYRERQTSFGEPKPVPAGEPKLSRREIYERLRRYREQRAN